MFRRRRESLPLAAALDAWELTLTLALPTRRCYRQILEQLLDGEDLTQIRAGDLAELGTQIAARWAGRSSRNRARTALRVFLSWGCAQSQCHRTLTPASIATALPMETLAPNTMREPTPLSLEALRAVLPRFAPRTRALVGLQVACGWRAADLVALRLADVSLGQRGVQLHRGPVVRDLVGPAISEVRAYVKQRFHESGSDPTAPLFEGCAGRPISASYARKALRHVALAVGSPEALLRMARHQGGGIGGW